MILRDLIQIHSSNLAYSRLIHVNMTILRIPLQGVSDKDIIKFKNEAFATALKPSADRFDKVIDPYPNPI